MGRYNYEFFFVKYNDLHFSGYFYLEEIVFFSQFNVCFHRWRSYVWSPITRATIISHSNFDQRLLFAVSFFTTYLLIILTIINNTLILNYLDWVTISVQNEYIRIRNTNTTILCILHSGTIKWFFFFLYFVLWFLVQNDILYYN